MAAGLKKLQGMVRVQATVVWLKPNGYRTNRQIPTFCLDLNLLGVVSPIGLQGQIKVIVDPLDTNLMVSWAASDTYGVTWTDDDARKQRERERAGSRLAGMGE